MIINRNIYANIICIYANNIYFCVVNGQIMTKINEKIKRDNVQTHIDECYNIINTHLPTSYSKKVQQKLLDRGIVISTSMIRNVRTRQNYNSDILFALVEIAKEAKEKSDALKDLINKC